MTGRRANAPRSGAEGQSFDAKVEPSREWGIAPDRGGPPCAAASFSPERRRCDEERERGQIRARGVAAMSLATLGLCQLVLVVAWTVGGVILRLGGSILILAGLLGPALGAGPGVLILAAVGAGVWVLGQAHHALRHGTYRGPLARLVLEGRDRPGAALPQETAPPLGAERRPGPRRCAAVTGLRRRGG